MLGWPPHFILRSYAYGLVDHLGSLLSKFEFAAVVSPVSGADQAKSGDFDF